MSQLIYMDGYDRVIDQETFSSVFVTLGMDEDVIDEVVTLWNNQGEDPIYDVDEYLLDEPRCTQEEREVIIESLSNFYLIRTDA